ncbi:urease accessory protein UreD [Sphingobacterium corticibacter]|uniref:Urease accessory protein UreD n=1 Tax=Sphingobacterium corticibacter TaxID=2171749 RepID=A0A2T8HME4_9SPHI|nr:urease accessory protein UreD [Sphingobacterium corticibacter]PVH26606.1 urease accessory protein UreD [Sphingobacterium corticibacter]
MESRININVERENQFSVLKESFHNAPYKLTHYGAPRAQPHLEMIIMSASPGIMDGDRLTINVNVKREAHMKLYTQSFNKLHPMKNGAFQDTIINLNENSVLHYIPHPVTPFKDSIFKAENSIHMDASSTLIWGDILGAGRIYMNEAFLFNKVHMRTSLYRNKQLIFTDNQCLKTADQPVRDMLFFEGYTHQATFIYSSPFATGMKAEMDEILAGEYEDISFGFTDAGENTILLRALGNDGELLYSFLSMLGQMCWEYTQHQQSLLLPEVVLENSKQEEERVEEALPARKKKTVTAAAKKQKRSTAA